MAGRKGILTQELMEKFEILLQKGATDKRAYEALGVSSSAFYAWLQRGREEIERRDALDLDADTQAEWAERGLAELVRRENPRIKPGSKLWATEQPYAEFATLWQAEQPFVEFLEKVTRARAAGQGVAEDCLYTALEPFEVITDVEETFSETRLKPDGTEYEYRRTVDRHTVTTQPGDWRAAIEYLGRRDPERWSKTDKVQHTTPLFMISADDYADAKRQMETYERQLLEEADGHDHDAATN